MIRPSIRIIRKVKRLYNAFTRPLRRHALDVVTHLPFSHFYFRPLFLNELYMALGLWEPYVFKSLNLTEGDVFIDVGAHIGTHSVYASQQVGKTGLVIAIEPDRRNLHLLRLNLAGKSNVCILERAVGPEGIIYLDSRNDPLYTRAAKHSGANREVRSIALDSLTEVVKRLKENMKYSVLVKIDVEGGEIDVVEGGRMFFAQFHPTLIIESLKPRKLRKILERLGFCGYRLFESYYLFRFEANPFKKEAECSCDKEGMHAVTEPQTEACMHACELKTVFK